jgi:flagellar hook-associated protein 1
MAFTLTSLHGRLSEIQRGLDQRAAHLIEDARGAAQRAADASAALLSSLLSTADIEDRRDRAVRDLVQILGAKSGADGQTVLLGGTAIIQGGIARPISIAPQSASIPVVPGGDPPAEPVWPANDLASEQVGGALGQVMHLRDAVIPSYLQELDRLAASLITEVNRIHASGTDLEGRPGTDLLVGTGVANIGVHPDAAADPRKLAASGTGAPGDGSAALAMARLSSDLGASYRSIVSVVGLATRAAQNRAEMTRLRMESLIREEQSISGVSLDEEMANLLRFQRAYEAAARVVTVTDELVSTLLGMGAR